MPVTPTYPGVYIEEIPSGVRTITGVATSITAFIGRAKRGSTDQAENKDNRALTINSYGDFERIYGGLWERSTLGFAVRDFFLNGGSQGIIVRLYHPTFADGERDDAKKAADAVATAATGNTAQEAATAARAEADKAENAKDPRHKAADYVATAAETAEAVSGATPDTVKRAAARAAKRIMAPVQAPLTIAKLPLIAAYPGAWGGYLRGTVDFDVSADTAASMGLDKGDLFNLTVFEEAPGGRTEQYRNLSLKDSARRIDTVLAAESHLVRWDTSNKPKDSIADIGSAQTKLATAQKEMQDAQTDDDKKKATQDMLDAQNALKDAVTVAEEKLAALKKAKASSDDIQKAQIAFEDAMDAMQSSDGIDLVENDFTGPGLEDAKSGLYALKLVPLFNILCIPPYKLGTDGYDVEPDLISTAAAYCEIRRAMLLVDPPSAWKDKDEAKGNGIDTGVAAVGTNSKNAAIYFPRLRQPNPLHNNQFEEFVPCGVIAGIWSRTDSQRGVWKAPAGLDATMVGVPLLTVPLNDAENGELNPLGINCLRAFPAAGRVVWGARTLQGDDRLASEWKYVPIRRLALFIEESLFRGTQWVVFEPNDEPLWAQIRLNVGAFMQDLFRKGAFQGTTASEAYFVKCDKETTTQNDRDHGIVNIIVGFAPLKPAEFVIIALQQMAGQIQV